MTYLLGRCLFNISLLFYDKYIKILLETNSKCKESNFIFYFQICLENFTLLNLELLMIKNSKMASLLMNPFLNGNIAKWLEHEIKSHHNQFVKKLIS